MKVTITLDDIIRLRGGVIERNLQKISNDKLDENFKTDVMKLWRILRKIQRNGMLW